MPKLGAKFVNSARLGQFSGGKGFIQTISCIIWCFTAEKFSNRLENLTNIGLDTNETHNPVKKGSWERSGQG